MSKSRVVSPFFWDDPEVAARLTRDERLFMVGCWTKLADDEGRFLADAPYVLKEVFGYDRDITPADILSMLAKICQTFRTWQMYANGGHSYVQIDRDTWIKHQGIKYVIKSKLPPPPPIENTFSEKVKESAEKSEILDYSRVELGSVELSSVGLCCVEKISSPICIGADGGQNDSIDSAPSTEFTLKPPDDDPPEPPWKEWFDFWWTEFCWYKTGKQDSEAAFPKAVEKQAKLSKTTLEGGFDDICRMTAGYLARFRELKEWEWRQNMHPATFIRHAHWNDEPKSGANGA